MVNPLDIRCVACGAKYPTDEMPYICSDCGGIFDFNQFPLPNLAIDDEKPGIWRYWQTFGLEKFSDKFYLGEGDTPLVWADPNRRELAFKMEDRNPTGSYKDRGSAVLCGHLNRVGVDLAVEDSSGNAGASFAAYSARTGVKARIFVPESASGPKREQIVRYGAELVAVPGPRAEAAKAVLDAVNSGITYASHAYLPHGMLGIATMAYEIVEQTEGRIGTIISPVGHGNLFLGIMRGFMAMQSAGWLDKLPTFIGVQAANCSPVFDQFSGKDNRDYSLPTIAEGVRVTTPVRAEAIVAYLSKIDGNITIIDEAELVAANARLMHHGILAEPTSALGYAAYIKLREQLPKPIVIVITGSGYKTKFR